MICLFFVEARRAEEETTTIVASVSTLYDLFYVFSEPLPLVFTLIHRIDEFTAHQRAPSLHVRRSASGHEDQFPLRRLTARSVIRKRTVAATRGNGRDALKAADRLCKNLLSSAT